MDFNEHTPQKNASSSEKSDFNLHGISSDIEKSLSTLAESTDAHLEAEVLKALLERPGFSIRTRLGLFFLLFFILSAGIATSSLVMLNKLQSKLNFLYVADNFANEIQQARRHEKNYFLYQATLENVQIHIDGAERLLLMNQEELRSVVGQQNVNTVEEHINKYKELISSLNILDRMQRSDTKAQYEEIENELRIHGQEMLTFTQDIAKQERVGVERMLQLAFFVPSVFLIALLAIMIYAANFFTKHIIGRLNRLMQATQQISRGDFTPMLPTRRFRDEFTNLAVALNSMMLQLEERQEILVQSHKLRAVGTLTAGVAHELNNPINNIMLTAMGLKEDFGDLPDDEKLDMINDLVEQAERSRKIVRNLLDFARKEELVSEHLDVVELVQKTIELVSNQSKLHKVKLSTKFNSHLPHVHGDKQQLSQVLLNLLLNALDVMPKGGELKVSVDHADDEGFLAIQVADTGKGIPEHIRGSIFDPFFTTKAKSKGTGLGLSVSLGIIRKHGGDIRVNSIVAEDPDSPSGSTFTILLPISTIPAIF